MFWAWSESLTGFATYQKHLEAFPSPAELLSMAGNSGDMVFLSRKVTWLLLVLK